VTRLLFLVLVIAACSKPADKAPVENGKIDPQLVQFCARNQLKMVNCLNDDQFWDIVSTMYFAKTGQKVGEEERKHWIGVLKDDVLALYRDRAFEKNCATSLEHNKAPSPRSVSTVTAAREKSCAEFASAFGYMVFQEGAFYEARQ
jgi:hypothetical protein